jgi:2-keto-3-deoxy-L-rhamnonate aldolase RhmA
MPIGDVARPVNEETLVVVMIEFPAGVPNYDEIASTPAST